MEGTSDTRHEGLAEFEVLVAWRPRQRFAGHGLRVDRNHMFDHAPPTRPPPPSQIDCDR